MRLSGDNSKSTSCANALLLPRGVLGGYNLALVENGRNREEALNLLKFLTGSEAQRILAFAGFLPTHAPLYKAENEQRIADISLDFPLAQRAIESSIVRPIIPRYQEFSGDVCKTITRSLGGDVSRLIEKADTDRWLEYFK
jgi:multiple sugar transport system substrate-binding protein